MNPSAHLPGVESVSARWQIGDWTVFPELRRLSCLDRVVRISPKAMAVLHQLASRPGEVVSRERLLETVWNGTLPTDDVLTHAVGELRRVFGDERAAPRYIETISKTGYRLIAPVERISNEPSAGAGQPSRGHREFGFVGAGLALLALLLATAVFLPRDHQQPIGGQRLDFRAKPITSEPGIHGQPAIAPGGNRVAYVMRTSRDLGYDLYVRATAESPGIRLTDTEANDFSPAWSPDGGSLAFVRFDDESCAVMIMPADGGQPRKVAECPNGGVSFLDWAPDGEWIAFSSLRKGAEVITLHEVSVGTGEVRPIEYDARPASHDIHPRYSPDGRLLAFQRRIGGYNEIFVVPRSGGEVRRVTHFEGKVLGADWWNDGRSLVVSSDHGGLRGLWRVGLDGSGEIFLGLPGARYPSTIPGSRGVAFERGDDSADIVEVELTGNSGPQPAISHPSTRSELSPRYAPDGKRLAFVSDRTGSQELWVAGSSAATRLTDHGKGEIVSPDWHPSGNLVAYVLRSGDRGSLFVVDPDYGQVRRLTADNMDVLSAAFVPPGDSIALSGRSDDGEWRVWRVRVDGSGLTPLPILDASRVAADADGMFLYFSKMQGNGLWRAAVDGATETKITDRIKFWNRSGWELVGDRLYYLDIDSRNATPGVHVLDLVSGESRRIRNIDFSLDANTLAISPDERRASLVSGGRQLSEVLVARIY